MLMLCMIDDFNISMLLIFTSFFIFCGHSGQGGGCMLLKTLKSKNTGLEILGKNAAVPCRKEQL